MVHISFKFNAFFLKPVYDKHCRDSSNLISFALKMAICLLAQDCTGHIINNKWSFLHQTQYRQRKYFLFLVLHLYCKKLNAQDTQP